MDIITRLNSFLNSISITSSQFADAINTPRPSVSQILNGRNKKISNELIEKIHVAFPNLNISWLLFGEGDMLMNDLKSPNLQHDRLENSNLQNKTEFQNTYSSPTFPQYVDKNQSKTDTFQNDEITNESFSDLNQPSANGFAANLFTVAELGAEYRSINNNSVDTNQNHESNTSSGNLVQNNLLNNPTDKPDVNSSIESSENSFQQVDSDNSNQNSKISQNPSESSLNLITNQKEIDRIIVFFSDNTYTSFIPEK